MNEIDDGRRHARMLMEFCRNGSFSAQEVLENVLENWMSADEAERFACEEYNMDDEDMGPDDAWVWRPGEPARNASYNQDMKTDSRIDPSRCVTLGHLRGQMEAWIVRDAGDERASLAWFGDRLGALRFVGEREYRLVGEDEVLGTRA